MAGQKERREVLEEAAAFGKNASPCCAHGCVWADGAKGGCVRKVADELGHNVFVLMCSGGEGERSWESAENGGVGSRNGEPSVSGIVHSSDSQ